MHDSTSSFWEALRLYGIHSTFKFHCYECLALQRMPGAHATLKIVCKECIKIAQKMSQDREYIILAQCPPPLKIACKECLGFTLLPSIFTVKSVSRMPRKCLKTEKLTAPSLYVTFCSNCGVASHAETAGLTPGAS